MSATAAPPRQLRRIDWERREKTCSRCLRTKGLDDFYVYEHKGRPRASSACRSCTLRQAERKRHEARGGERQRMPRYNAAGEAWCPNCRRYRCRADFRPHPSRPGHLWAYCRECTVELDRIRYRYRDKAAKREEHRRSCARKRQRNRAAMAERDAFVRQAISTLKRRGFTRADICALGRFNQGNVIEWETGARRQRGIQRSVERTFGELLRLTAGYAAGPRERKGGRPHPDLPVLAEAMDRLWPTLGRRRRRAAA